MTVPKFNCYDCHKPMDEYCMKTIIALSTSGNFTWRAVQVVGLHQECRDKRDKEELEDQSRYSG